MPYIRGTLYAPASVDRDAFRRNFELLTQASFEVTEPSVIETGECTDNSDIRLRVTTVLVEDSALSLLEGALSTLFDNLDVTIEAVGDKVLHPKDNFLGNLAVTTQLIKSASERRDERAQEKSGTSYGMPGSPDTSLPAD